MTKRSYEIAHQILKDLRDHGSDAIDWNELPCTVAEFSDLLKELYAKAYETEPCPVKIETGSVIHAHGGLVRATAGVCCVEPVTLGPLTAIFCVPGEIFVYKNVIVEIESTGAGRHTVTPVQWAANNFSRQVPPELDGMPVIRFHKKEPYSVVPTFVDSSDMWQFEVYGPLFLDFDVDLSSQDRKKTNLVLRTEAVV